MAGMNSVYLSHTACSTGGSKELETSRSIFQVSQILIEINVYLTTWSGEERGGEGV